jgi:hypothetical protein
MRASTAHERRISKTLVERRFDFFRTMPFIGIGGVYFCTVLEDRVVYFGEPTPVLGVA